ncbi:MAG: hypothetical protein AB1631_09770 [Acidobacteriota bacterium]
MAALESSFIDEAIEQHPSMPEFFGLISGTDACWLHGFEVDLEGRVVMPRLRPDHTRVENISRSGSLSK